MIDGESICIGKHYRQDWYSLTGTKSTGAKVLGYFFKDMLMDLSTPDEYREAETLHGTIYTSGKDFNGFHIKKIKERNDSIGIVMLNNNTGVEEEVKVRKDQLAALRKWR